MRSMFSSPKRAVLDESDQEAPNRHWTSHLEGAIRENLSRQRALTPNDDHFTDANPIGIRLHSGRRPQKDVSGLPTVALVTTAATAPAGRRLIPAVPV